MNQSRQLLLLIAIATLLTPSARGACRPPDLESTEAGIRKLLRERTSTLRLHRLIAVSSSGENATQGRGTGQIYGKVNGMFSGTQSTEAVADFEIFCHHDKWYLVNMVWADGAKKIYFTDAAIE